MSHHLSPSSAEYLHPCFSPEVSLDANRTWCPSAGCDTICHICTGTKSQGVAVTCPTCVKEFCSLCSATWHPGLTCAENGAFLVKQGGEVGDLAMWIGQVEGENIKRCPMCAVPIERDAGCAQMMCKRCKHVFCWYCLVSLDVSLMLYRKNTYVQHMLVFSGE